MIFPSVKDMANATTRLTGHVELYKRDEETRKLTLVTTSRPCEICGKPLEGLVVPMSDARSEGQSLIHDKCRGNLGVGGFQHG